MKTIIKLISFGFIILLSNYGISQVQNKTVGARIQLIHNSADEASKAVDVYLNGKLIIDNFEYLTASPFINAPSTTPVRIDIAPYTSSSVQETIYSTSVTLQPEQRYVIVASGLKSNGLYNPFRPFGLFVYGQGFAFDSNRNTKITFVNGTTDAPPLSIVETSIPLGLLANAVSYGESSSEFFNIRTADYQINLYNASQAAPRPSVNESTLIASFSLPLATLKLQNKAITLITSGFLDREQNNNGAAFGLFIALPAGGALIPLQRSVLSIQDFSINNILMYPNPASSYINIEIPFQYNNASAKITDLSGREISKVDDVNKQINISQLSNGMYLLNLEIDNQLYMQKFYVNK